MMMMIIIIIIIVHEFHRDASLEQNFSAAGAYVFLKIHVTPINMSKEQFQRLFYG